MADDVVVLQAAKADAKRKYIVTLRPSGDDDSAAINAALVSAKKVVLHDPDGVEFKLIASGIVMQPRSTLIINDCTVRRHPDGADVATTNSQLITNASARTLNGSSSTSAVPDRRIRVFGVGNARLIGQTSATIQASVAAGDTTMQLSAALPAGTYEWGDNVSGTSEPITIVNGNSTGATAAPYTATLAAPITTPHTYSASSLIGITNITRHYSSGSQTLWSNIGIAWVNVDDVVVDGVEIGPCRAFAGNTQISTNVRWQNIRLAQDGSSLNQDGLDVGPGSSNIHMRGIVGTSGDDVFSLYAQNTSQSLHPFTTIGAASRRDILGVYISGVKTQVVQTGDFMRFQAGDGSKCRRIFVHDVTNYSATARPAVLFGNTSWVGTPPAMTDMGEIVIDGYEGPFSTFIAADSNFQDVHIRNVKNSVSWSKLLGPSNPVAGFSPQVRQVHFSNITLPITGLVSSAGNLFQGAVGSFEDCSFRDIFASELRAITKPTGTATLTNVTIEGIHVKSMLDVPFQDTTASTGWADGLFIDGYLNSPTATFAGAAPALRLGPRMPTLTSLDAAPNPTQGSTIRTDGSYDPTGAGYLAPATFVADGTAWVRQASGNGLGFPATIDPGLIRATDSLALPSANSAVFMRVRDGGTIGSIGLQVATSSGNISVAAFKNTGIGRAARPGALLASSGAVACPAGGYSSIPLSSTVTVQPGDWLAISADNTTATFRSLFANGIDSSLGSGRQCRASTAHPLAGTPGSTTSTIGYTFTLVGV